MKKAIAFLSVKISKPDQKRNEIKMLYGKMPLTIKPKNKENEQ